MSYVFWCIDVGTVLKMATQTAGDLGAYSPCGGQGAESAEAEKLVLYYYDAP